MEKEKLDEILKKHAAWLNNEDGGERADLSCADLGGADLGGADLSGADLSCADLSGATFEDRIFCLDRIGSVKRRTTYNATKDIVWCGCFTGTFDEWVAKIRKTYPDESNVYRKEYEAAIAYFKAVAEANEENARKRKRRIG